MEANAVAERLQVPAPPISDTRRPLVGSRRRDRDFALRRALVGADAIGLFLALALAMALAGTRQSPLAESLWLLPTLPCWALLFWAYLLYRRPVRRFEPTHLDDLSSLFHALLLGTLALWVYYQVLPARPLEVAELLIFGALALLLIAGLRAALRVANLHRQGPERVFAVAPSDDVRVLRRKLENHPEYEMSLVGAVRDRTGLDDSDLPLHRDLDEIEALLVTGQIDHLVVRLDSNYISEQRVQELMYLCHREGIRFGLFPGLKALFMPGVEMNHAEGMGILTSNPPILSRASRTMKRGLDLFLASILFVLLAPAMLLIAALVKLDSRGPALFKQVRVGKDGRRFELVKFRTMLDGAEGMTEELMVESGDPNWLLIDDDPRVTRLGRLLRRSSLDELPQLWNVIKGEMSLVGPRPLPQRDDDGVRGWRRHRLDLVPGITGYWQVLGRTSMPFEEMLEADYAYVANWSLFNDLKLLLRTVPVVIRGRGAN